MDQEPRERLDVGLTINLVLCGLGAGILSLPWTMAGSGVVNGMIWTLVVLSAAYFTIMLLVRAGEKEQCFNMEGLVERAAPGSAEAKKMWALTCTASIWVSNFICLVGYMIIIADSIVPTLDSLGVWDDAGLTAGQARRMVLILGMACIWPCCYLNQQQLEKTSSLGTFSNCFIVFALVLNYFVLEKKDDNQAFCALSTPITTGNLAFTTNLLMAITIQPCMLPMYEEMNTDPETSRPLRTPKNFARALRIAWIILYVLFVVFAAAGYITYGSAVAGNVLTNLPSAEWYTVVSRISMVGVCLGVYPLMLYPMVAPLGPRWRSTGISLLNICSLGSSLFVANLGLLNMLNGALGVFFLFGLFPAVIALGVLSRLQPQATLGQGLLHQKDSPPSCWYSRPPMFALTAVALTTTVVGLTNTTNHAQLLSRNCLWSV